jgi:hypothetical protein
MPAIDLGNLAACIKDTSDAVLEPAASPPDPAIYQDALAKLAATRGNLPPLYRDAALDPLLTYLQNTITAADYARLVAAPSAMDSRLLLGCVQAVLQHGGRKAPETSAFQEVVSDLYDGFLSDEDRRGVKKPDRGLAAPLVIWRDPDLGPYAFKSTTTAKPIGLKVGIVSLPPYHASKGLCAWALLGHETAGHEILSADDGLEEELAKKIDAALPNNGELAQYWINRLEETASDVMGILNMGPAAAIGFIAYSRGRNLATNQADLLPSTDSFTHPPATMRGYLAAATVRLLSFSGHEAWAQEIEKLTDKDVPRTSFKLDNTAVDPPTAKQLAKILADIIAGTPLDALEQHSLIEIQNWDDEDQRIANGLRRSIKSGTPPDEIDMDGIYAAHTIAAAISLAAAEGDPRAILNQAIVLLEAMHTANPSWGPLLIDHPGALEPDYAFPRAERIALRRARRKREKLLKAQGK